jgi:hypothetical protein
MIDAIHIHFGGGDFGRLEKLSEMVTSAESW